MTAFDSAPVLVQRDAEGTIRIGAERPSGVLTERLALEGAEITIDLAHPGAVPYAVIDNPSKTLWWLQFVYGDAVADDVRRLADPEAPPLAGMPLSSPGFLASPVLRFAVGLWLLRWWPSKDAWSSRGSTGVALTDVGEKWLLAELGTLAWFAEAAFGGKELARALLSDQVQTVLVLAGNSPGSTRPLAIVRAVLESVPVDDSTHEELQALERAIARSSRITSDMDWNRALGALRESEPTTAGSGRGRDNHLSEDIVAVGTSTVAWGRVRSRLLSASEQNVTWAVEQTSEDHASVDVRVAVGDRWESDAVIYAAIHRNGNTDPDEITTFQLESPSSSTLVAWAEIPPAREGDVFSVLVFDETDLQSGRPEPAADAATRDSITSAVRRLIGGLSYDLADEAPYDLAPFEPWPVPDAT